MSWIFVSAALLMVAAIILAWVMPKQSRRSVTDAYRKADALFTPAERSFHGVLSQAVGDKVHIFGKVRVADVILPRNGLSRSEWQKAFNKVAVKHFDCLLCTRDEQSVLCAIELDDRSHRSAKRQERDAFLKQACSTAGVPLIQIPVSAGYVLGEVRQLVAPYLDHPELPVQMETPAPEAPPAGDKICRKCGSPMAMRVAKRGPRIGKRFWACSAYPRCKQIETIETSGPIAARCRPAQNRKAQAI